MKLVMLALLATTAFATVAAAAQPAAPATYGVASAPPAQFDHPYTDGTLVIQFVERGRMNDTCRGRDSVACQTMEGSTCTISVLRPVPSDLTLDQVIRHEVGLCNGWSDQPTR
jgi:hypothetical protein